VPRVLIRLVGDHPVFSVSFFERLEIPFGRSEKPCEVIAPEASCSGIRIGLVYPRWLRQSGESLAGNLDKPAEVINLKDASFSKSGNSRISHRPVVITHPSTSGISQRLKTDPLCLAVLAKKRESNPAMILAFSKIFFTGDVSTLRPFWNH
jgi:hypothetical protein